MATKHGLGRGIGALIRDGSSSQEPATAGPGVLRVPVDKIRKNTFQPRQKFEREPLAELIESVKTHGVLQPLLVRPAGKGYELIAGERRLRASGEAGLTEVPVIVVEATDTQALELALVENLQREDLGILEEAEGYQALAHKFDLTQEQIAARVGKARATVTNALRLLSLSEPVKQLIAAGKLSPGHAKVLLGVEIADEQSALAERCVNEGLSVRQLEQLVRKARNTPRKARAAKADIPTNHLRHLSETLHTHFGTSVRLTASRTFANGKKGKGSIEIDFYSNDDLDRILNVACLGSTELPCNTHLVVDGLKFFVVIWIFESNV